MELVEKGCNAESEGPMLGNFDGENDGIEVGLNDDDGTELGGNDGSGDTLGSKLGTCEGDCDVPNDGDSLGRNESVGGADGAFVGRLVGSNVG
mmetsp:Transcript_1707/g.3754  ORF Transcript_1707/g.3754 Transcript_1707/m.3754 type:complete len:93 (-) Transcript_1707:2287-2565(-)